MEKKIYITPSIIDVELDTEFVLKEIQGSQSENPPDAESKLREFYSDDSESSSEFFPTNFGDF